MTQALGIACEGVWKYYPGATAPALQDVSLSIAPNEFVTFVGASGCGKSTLLRTIAGLESYSQGLVSVAGQAVTGPGPDRAMVFQHYSLYPWLNVLDNIKFCRKLKVHTEGRTSSDVEDAAGRADALLRLMGLTHVAKSYPSELSGGMQQRVAIAREVMHDLIKHVHHLERTTIVFVTHDVDEAIYLGDRIVLMAPRPGRIDSVLSVPLPSRRTQDMKLSPEFLQLKRTLLDRIRDTSGMKTDFELLDKLSRSAEAVASGADQ